jgi:hypothetical protein
MPAPEDVRELVKRFEEHHETYRSSRLSSDEIEIVEGKSRS